MTDTMDQSNLPPKKRRRTTSQGWTSSNENSVDLTVKEEPQSEPENEESPETSFAEPSNSTRIIDLNKKCLVHILKHLDFIDFLNAANATKAIRESACEIYRERYAGLLVKYSGDAMNMKGLELDITDTTIEINDARTCLKMLRGFGDHITKLRLNFNGIGPRRSQAITQALNEYCPKTLIDLDWLACPKDSIGSRKFTQLQSLRIFSGMVGNEMGQFNYFFPKLCRLELSNVEVSDRKCIEKTFHNVYHLKVNIEIRRGMDFLKTNVKTTLKLNPQLSSFSLGAGCDAKLIRYINEQLPKLDTFEIQNPRNKFFDSKEQPVCFNKVNSFALDIADSKDAIKNIPFKFARLKKFTLNACARYRDEWIDFAVQNPRLNVLKLLNYHWFYVVKREQLMKIAKLGRLKSVLLDWRVDSAESVSQFIEKCSSLQKIRISMKTRPERAAICSKVKDEWTLDIDEHFLTLERDPY